MRNNGLLMFAVLLALPSIALASEPRFPNPPGKSGKSVRAATTVSFREESDHKAAVDLGKIDNYTPVVVPPETTTVVTMINSDVNRIVCPVDIKDVVCLKEKGVSIKVTGKDAFVNFKFVKKGGKTLYASEPTEMYVICGQDTYNLVVIPRSDVPPQTIRLSSGIDKKIKANNELLGSLPFEKKIMHVIKDVFTDQLADSYSVAEVNKQIGNWQEINVIHKKNVDIEGEGLRVKEYTANLKQGQLPFKLSEKIFTKKNFAVNPVAVSLEKHILRPGKTVRVFVVEQRQEKLQKSLYRNKETTELNPLDDQLAMQALEGSFEPETKSSKDSEKDGEADE